MVHLVHSSLFRLIYYSKEASTNKIWAHSLKGAAEAAIPYGAASGPSAVTRESTVALVTLWRRINRSCHEHTCTKTHLFFLKKITLIQSNRKGLHRNFFSGPFRGTPVVTRIVPAPGGHLRSGIIDVGVIVNAVVKVAVVICIVGVVGTWGKMATLFALI